jgi:transcriptional regulator with XRE-family HTH domain
MVEMGARVRVGRRQAGLSQRTVADRAGVSQSEVSRLERGQGGNISTYRFVAICFAIGPSFPFGDCPHPHVCTYTRPNQPTTHSISRP